MANQPAGKLVEALIPSANTRPAGRPDKFDSQRRVVRFLELVAGGARLREAAGLAGIDPARALDLVQDRDAFDQQVRAVREGLAA